MTDELLPFRWANYPGDVRQAIGQVMGPNLLGEFLVVVAATYDPAANRTRLGFRYATPADIGQRWDAK